MKEFDLWEPLYSINNLNLNDRVMENQGNELLLTFD